MIIYNLYSFQQLFRNNLNKDLENKYILKSRKLSMNIPVRFEQYSPDNFYKGEINQYYGQINFPSEQKSDQYQPSDNGSDIAIKHQKYVSSSFTYEENMRVILEGWIKKKTLNSYYQERYFVLTPTRLCYFTNKQKTDLKGCFNFVSLCEHQLVVIIQKAELKLKVSPKSHAKVFQNRFIIQLQFQNNQKALEWYTQISYIVQQLQLKSKIMDQDISNYFPKIYIENLLQTNQKIASQYNHNYWNKLDISEHELYAYCSHLDILLLRSKNPISYLSRFFMRSYYDHVALIIKSQLHEIYVFEAIQSRGVCLIDLQTWLTINADQYQEIGYRRLIVEQTEDEENEGLYKGVNIERLQIYLNSLLGKNYELSLSKLILGGSEFDRSEQTTRGVDQSLGLPNQSVNKVEKKQKISMQQIVKEKTYFCSELIADIYLKFGIIKKGKSKDFWPKDFQQNSIKFRQNATFSPIMNVCWKDEGKEI